MVSMIINRVLIDRDVFFIFTDYNTNKLLDDIAEAIRSTYISQEKNLIAAARKYSSSRLVLSFYSPLTPEQPQ